MKGIFTIGFLLCYLSVTGQTIDSLKLMADLKEISSDKYQGRKPDTYGGRLAQYYIAGRFNEIGLRSFHENFRQGFAVLSEKIDKNKPDSISNYKKVFGANIIGYIPGRSKQAIVISAHYDHLGMIDGEVYNGADDNASGVSALLSIAEYFVLHPPDHTLIFAAFDAEEMFMRGSLAFVADPPLKIGDLVLNVNMDLIGTSKNRILYVGGTRYSPAFKPVLKYISEKANMKLLFGYDTPNTKEDRTYRSDHSVFHLAEIPFLYFGVPEHEHYHTPTDDYQNITHSFYYQATNFILQSLVAIDREFPIDQKTKKPRSK